MKKDYKTPDLEIVEIALKDVILSSPTEDPISSGIGGGGGTTSSGFDLDGDL